MKRAIALLIAMLSVTFAGCVSNLGFGRGARISDNLEIYEPFDNSRPWGPSYLLGPPAHHLGDEARVGDGRVLQQVNPEPQQAPQKPPTLGGPLPPLP